MLEPVTYAQIPGWPDDSHGKAYDAFIRSAQWARDHRYKSGSLGICFDTFDQAYKAALGQARLSDRDARRFFENYFQPERIVPDCGDRGFVTGYYEPIVQAARHKSDCFSVPIYRQPDDLVRVPAGLKPEGIDPAFEFARQTAGGWSPFPDRRSIESGALAGRDLELAWLENPVDAFFIHVQGAARLVFNDNTSMRITYAAKSGHPFTGPGRVLAQLGEMAPETITMQTIRAWLARNPHRINEILWQNRSFIFFRQAPVDSLELGPIAAAKVPLTPGRSLAVDRRFHTFGTPVYVACSDLTAFDGKPFRRLMIAQDTGSAIVGNARGDLFAGSGFEAGEIAGIVRNSAEFFALIPRDLRIAV